MFLFGNQKLWELEVKFPTKPDVGHGEVEFECHKKKGSSIEVKFELEELLHNKAIEIHLDNRLIYTVATAKNSGNRIYSNENLKLQKPTEGDKIDVTIGRQNQFEGALVRD